MRGYDNWKNEMTELEYSKREIIARGTLVLCTGSLQFQLIEDSTELMRVIRSDGQYYCLGSNDCARLRDFMNDFFTEKEQC